MGRHLTYGATTKFISGKPNNAEVAKLIQSMLYAGDSPKSIADDMGMTTSAVYQTIRAYGLKRKKASS